MKCYEVYWAIASHADKPAMAIHAAIVATNITSAPVSILAARLEAENTKRMTVLDQQVHTRHPERNVYGSYPLLPGVPTPITASFIIQPPICEPGNALKATTLVLIDQFANERKVKNLIFRSY